jgi:hypothetical protein
VQAVQEYQTVGHLTPTGESNTRVLFRGDSEKLVKYARDSREMRLKQLLTLVVWAVQRDWWLSQDGILDSKLRIKELIGDIG